MNNSKKYNPAQKRLGALNINDDILKDEYNELIEKYEKLAVAFDKLKKEHEALKREHNRLQGRINH